MNRAEKSLLLYIETCAVDSSGRMDTLKINAEDIAILNRWRDIGFIEYGRIASSYFSPKGSLWVKLSDDAFELAHQERKARAGRMWEKRRYATTAEVQ